MTMTLDMSFTCSVGSTSFLDPCRYGLLFRRAVHKRALRNLRDFRQSQRLKQPVYCDNGAATMTSASAGKLTD
jgi:hypothetical protein